MNITIFRKMYRDHWKSLLSWGAVIIFMATIELTIYPSIVKSGDAAKQFIDSYPDGRMNASEMKVCENERN